LKLLRSLEAQNDWPSFRDAVRNRCATDLEAFAVIFFPHYCKYAFNTFHTDTFKQYKFGERAIRRVSAAPRGFAKSTLKVLIKPVHDLCYKLEKFVVIISNTSPQAEQKVKDIQTEFITNDLLLAIYGEFIPSRKVGSTDFVGINGEHKCRFLALGSGTEMRGIRFGDVRPTKIILDDVEHSEEVENEMLRDKLLGWYQDVVSKIGDERTNIEIVGTVLHQKSLLKNLLNNPRYESAQYTAVISWAERKDLWEQWEKIYRDLDCSDRTHKAKAFYMANQEEMDRGVEVLWPEKEPYYYLMEEIMETGMRSFMKEKQNNPMSNSEKVFFEEEIWWYNETPDGLLIEKNNVLIPWNQVTAYGAIDPSTGQRKITSKRKPDFTCIVSGYKDAKGRLFVHHDFTKRVPPSQFISEIFNLHERFQYHNFGVETNLYKNLLTQNIIDEKKRREKEFKKSISIRFVDVEQTENKEKRIYSLEPKIPHGWILFNRALSQEFMGQLYDFPKGNNDDGPDCLEIVWGLVNNKYAVGSF
jgi:predicted phage terminase large subunit-like protein